jgi:hypothetical protein
MNSLILITKALIHLLLPRFQHHQDKRKNLEIRKNLSVLIVRKFSATRATGYNMYGPTQKRDLLPATFVEWRTQSLPIFFSIGELIKALPGRIIKLQINYMIAMFVTALSPC